MWNKICILQCIPKIYGLWLAVYVLACAIFLPFSFCKGYDESDYLDNTHVKKVLAGHFFMDQIPYQAFQCNLTRLQVIEKNLHFLPSWLNVDTRNLQITGVPQKKDVGTYNLVLIGIGKNWYSQEYVCKSFARKIIVEVSPNSLLESLSSIIQNATNLDNDRENGLASCKFHSSVVIATLLVYEKYGNNSTNLPELTTHLQKIFNIPGSLIQLLKEDNSLLLVKQLKKISILHSEGSTNSVLYDKALYISWPITCGAFNLQSYLVHNIHRRSIEYSPDLSVGSFYLTSGEYGRSHLRKRRAVFFGSVTALEGTPIETSHLPSQISTSNLFTSIPSSTSPIVSPSITILQSTLRVSAYSGIKSSSFFSAKLDTTSFYDKSDASSVVTFSATSKTVTMISPSPSKSSVTLFESSYYPRSSATKSAVSSKTSLEAFSVNVSHSSSIERPRYTDITASPTLPLVYVTSPSVPLTLSSRSFSGSTTFPRTSVLLTTSYMISPSFFATKVTQNVSFSTTQRVKSNSSAVKSYVSHTVRIERSVFTHFATSSASTIASSNVTYPAVSLITPSRSLIDSPTFRRLSSRLTTLSMKSKSTFFTKRTEYASPSPAESVTIDRPLVGTSSRTFIPYSNNFTNYINSTSAISQTASEVDSLGSLFPTGRTKTSAMVSIIQISNSSMIRSTVPSRWIPSLTTIGPISQYLTTYKMRSSIVQTPSISSPTSFFFTESSGAMKTLILSTQSQISIMPSASTHITTAKYSSPSFEVTQILSTTHTADPTHVSQASWERTKTTLFSQRLTTPIITSKSLVMPSLPNFSSSIYRLSASSAGLSTGKSIGTKYYSSVTGIHHSSFSRSSNTQSESQSTSKNVSQNGTIVNPSLVSTISSTLGSKEVSKPYNSLSTATDNSARSTYRLSTMKTHKSSSRSVINPSFFTVTSGSPLASINTTALRVSIGSITKSLSSRMYILSAFSSAGSVKLITSVAFFKSSSSTGVISQKSYSTEARKPLFTISYSLRTAFITSTSLTGILPFSSAIYMASLSTTSRTPNLSPVIRNSIGRLTAYIGRLLVFRIPYDTFYDAEDGFTNNLELTCRLSNGRSIPTELWVKFDNVSQTVFGLPLQSDYQLQAINGLELEVVATDRMGYSVRDVFNLYIKKVNLPLLFSITATIQFNYATFIQNSWLRIKLLNRIIQFYNTSQPQDYYTVNIRNGSVLFTWSDTSVGSTTCNKSSITDLLRKIQLSSGSPTSEFSQALLPEFPVLQLSMKYEGACLLPATITPPSSGPGVGQRDGNIFVRYVVPLLAVAFIAAVIVATVVFISKRRRNKPSFLEKQTFKRGQPVLLPEELELNTFPSSAVTLPEDYIYDKKLGRNGPMYLKEDEYDLYDDEDGLVKNNEVYGLRPFVNLPPPYQQESKTDSIRQDYESPYLYPAPTYQLPPLYIQPEDMTSEV